MAPPSVSITLGPSWLDALGSMRGEKLAVAAHLLARARDAVISGQEFIHYSERDISAAVGATRHAVTSAIAELEIDGLLHLDRSDHRHQSSRMAIDGVTWQTMPARLPVFVMREVSDEASKSQPVKHGSIQPVKGQVSQHRDSQSRPTQRVGQPVKQTTIQPVRSTSQNRGPGQVTEESQSGRFVTTPLTREVSQGHLFSGSAPTVTASADPESGDREPEETQKEVERPTGPRQSAKRSTSAAVSTGPSTVAQRMAAMPKRALAAADWLRAKILAQQPGNRIRVRPWDENDSTRLGWAEEFRRLAVVDGRSYDDIARVLAWLFGEQPGECQFVVLSPQSLRKKWDAIEIARARVKAAPRAKDGRRSDAEEQAAAAALRPRAPTRPELMPPRLPVQPGPSQAPSRPPRA